MRIIKLSIINLLCLLLYSSESTGQNNQGYAPSVYQALEYRNIGPFRGGRSAAVTGVPGQPMTFYFGGTGGGTWKTTNGGQSWSNISDGYFGGSIGAVAVSAWDPNVIYVGGGEKTVRGNVSSGYGMWKSTDAGKTWNSIGLSDSRHIARIRIHPRNPELVYAAVMGHLSGPNDQRGVYRSKDGGTTWERVHFVSSEVGAVDLVMDPTNARILYACLWRIKRTPYSLESGGESSGVFKSTDGGDTWQEITRNKGLPQSTVGISGVTISPVNPDRIWLIIEAEDGGVFRSDDGGDTWREINSDRSLRQRAWYYTRIYADTQNEDIVYVLNVGFWRSKDGGKSYERISTPHGDHHDLWIDPEDANHMIIGDDGGAQITFNGGKSWSTYHNQPTAQFYRVTTDNHFPYRIYGAQQDNSTVRILHRSDSGSITERHWEPTAGGESGHIAPHPLNPDIVYGGSYGGLLIRRNHRTGETRNINPWPDNPMGHGAADLRHRFQWNFPISFSPHDPNILYSASQELLKSTNEGQSWIPISGDLTRNDKSTMGPSGGPITKDNTSIEYYGTIFAALESHHEPGVIWAGTDDGLIHVTKDHGQNWTDVTPDERIFPEWMMVNSIEIHPTEPGGLYVAGTRYKLDDFKPYLYKTTDYGENWTLITTGIDDGHFTRVIRSDPKRSGLLYAGTESGMYISFNDGSNWTAFQQNLPIVPITDLTIKQDDLIVATQGRAFWVMDDLTPLHQLSPDVTQSDLWLFSPRPTYRMAGFQSSNPGNNGKNPPAGVVLRFHFKEKPDSSSVRINILETDGSLIKSFRADDTDDPFTVDKGMNEFVWNMRYEDAERFDGIILWAGGLQGPKAAPGKYLARLIFLADSTTVEFDILKDPRIDSSEEDLTAQFNFLMEVRDKLSETHSTIKRIRTIREQVEDIIERVANHDQADTVKSSGTALLEKFKQVEEALYQTKNRSNQDPLNYPIRNNNKLSGLVSVVSRGDYKPTEQAIEVKNEITMKIDSELSSYQLFLRKDLPAFNALIKSLGIPAVIIDMDVISVTQ